MVFQSIDKYLEDSSSDESVKNGVGVQLDPKSPTCRKCGKVVGSIQGLSAHVRTHHEIPVGTEKYSDLVEPEQDRMKSVSESEPSKRKKRKEKEVYILECPVCGSSCKGIFGMSRHLGASHHPYDWVDWYKDKAMEYGSYELQRRIETGTWDENNLKPKLESTDLEPVTEHGKRKMKGLDPKPETGSASKPDPVPASSGDDDLDYDKLRWATEYIERFGGTVDIDPIPDLPEDVQNGIRTAIQTDGGVVVSFSDGKFNLMHRSTYRKRIQALELAHRKRSEGRGK